MFFNYTKENLKTVLIKAVRPAFLLVCMVLAAQYSFAQPANDEPCNAIPLTVGSTCTFTQYTNAAATATAGVPAPGCANYAGGDVWFSVTVPAGGTLIFDSQQGVITDAGMAIYSGTCSALTLIECDDDDSQNGLMSYIYRTGLTPGSTVWIRFWEYGGNNNGTFGICVTTPPPPPANNDCAAAVGLTVNPTLTCTTVTPGTTIGATQSAVPAPTCGAGGINDDVWFSFTATNATHRVSLLNVTGGATDMAMALYGGTCGALTQLACSDPNTMDLCGLNPGQTYYLRVWTFTATQGVGANFNVCVGTTGAAPANDDPCNAITVPYGYSCSYQTFSNLGACASSGVPAPGCANYQGGDVWFKTTVPCEGKLIFDSRTGTITDGGMAIYRGTCGALTLIECDDDDSQNGAMPRIQRNDLVPGETIWVRMWEYGNDNNGTFGLCISVPPPPPPAASCQTAQSFCTSATPFTVPNITGVPSTASGGVFGCLGSIPNPTYYYLQIQNSGSITIRISQQTTAGVGIDVDFIVWGPFNSLNATCTGISASNIVDCSYSTAAVEFADIPNAVAGEFYLFLVTNFNGQAGTITYQQTGGTGSSNCNIVCSVNASNSGPVCPGGSVNLFATDVTGGNYSWTGPNCFTSTQQNPTTVTPPVFPGQYVYYVTVQAPNGTTCYDTTMVTVLPAPSLGADSTVMICSGATADLTTLYNTTNLTTAWTNASNGAVLANPSAVGISGIYQLVATNTSGCNDTVLVNLLIDTVRAVAATVNANCTTDGTISITAQTGLSPFTYAISTSPTVYQVSNVFNAAAGSYTVSVKDSLGCTVSIPVTVEFTNNLSVTARTDTAVCAGGASIVLSTSGNATGYSWSPATGLDDASSANPVYTPGVSGVYPYELTATLGQCTTKDTVTITVFDGVQVNIIPATLELVNGEQIVMQATANNAVSYQWTPPTGLNSTSILNPVLTAETIGTTTYTLTATNRDGCKTSDNVLVTIIPYCAKVANTFTPNGDGVNDLWTVYDNIECLINVEVLVFNRYGNKVYENRTYRNNWNGSYQGKPVPDGTYYAVVKFSLVNGRIFTVKSDLTILR
ncbi:MAG: gliding motility-associated C-terminal domain-containing protein [Ferruginibacter sp.]